MKINFATKDDRSNDQFKTYSYREQENQVAGLLVFVSVACTRSLLGCSRLSQLQKGDGKA
jgi:hypothetical protein